MMFNTVLDADKYNGPYCHICGTLTKTKGGHPLSSDIRTVQFWQCDDHGPVFIETHKYPYYAKVNEPI